MKKTIITFCVVSAAVFALTATPAFAATQSRSAGREKPRMERGAPQPQKQLPPRTANGTANAGARTRNHGVGAPAADARADLFGTVSAVSVDNALVTIKDADGKETQVHVNPLTRLSTHSAAGKAGKASGARGTGANKRIALSDIAVGDWVAVSKLGGDTAVLEAKHILVAKK